MMKNQKYSPVRNVRQIPNSIVFKLINNIATLFIQQNNRQMNIIGKSNLLFFFWKWHNFWFLSLKCNKIVFSHDHIHEHQIQRTSAFLIDTIDSCCSSPPSVHHCYLCRTNFDTPIKMHIHLIEHQYPHRDYQCSLCQQKSFDDASQLYHHMVQHGSKARLHPCRECDIYFMFSMHLINHQYSHDEDPKIKSIKKPSKSISNNDDEEKDICKSMVTRSATKRTCRSVIVN